MKIRAIIYYFSLAMILLFGAVNIIASEWKGVYELTFVECPDNKLTDGWSSHGLGYRASGNVSGESKTFLDYFPVGHEGFIVFSHSGITAAYSNSNTEAKTAVDEWLISPEILLPSNPQNLLFDVITFGSSKKSSYSIFISEDGGKTYESNPIYRGEIAANTRMKVGVSLAGYENKTVTLAFVNQNNSCGAIGFNNFSIADYSISIESITPEYTCNPGSYDMAFKVSIMTPVKSSGFNAVLTLNDDNYELSNSLNLGNKFSSYSLSFPATVELKEGMTVPYKLTITPKGGNLEELKYEHNSQFRCVEGFDPVVIVEEATGTWCQWCAGGIAALEKYSDDYGQQFIGIAVHNQDNMTNTEYDNGLKGISSGGYPSFVYDRNYITSSPFDHSYIDEQMKSRVPYQVKIEKARFDASNSGFDVEFKPMLAYDSQDLKLAVAAVLLEDGCTGVGGGWIQSNAYSGYSESKINTTAQEDGWWPYFKEICEGSSYLVGLKFNHVGWGIYPSFDGDTSILSEFSSSDNGRHFSIDFEGSPNIQNIENVNIALLLIDANTGKILTGDKKRVEIIDDFFVNSACIEKLTVRKEGNRLIINTDDVVNVALYGLMGSLIDFYDNVSGEIKIDLANDKEMLIVNIKGSTFSKSFKII